MSRKERHGSQPRDWRVNRPAELVAGARASLQADWLPDLFAAVFDVVAFNGAGMRFNNVHAEHAEALGSFIEAHLKSLQRSQDRQLGSIPDAFKTFVESALSRYASGAGDQAGRELMFALHAIDRLLWGLAPASGGSDEWLYLALYRALLREGRTLLRDMPGYLLPRMGRAARPARTECDFFSNLCRVRAHDGCAVRYLLFDELNPTGDVPSGRRSLRVGVLATVQHHNELSWTPDAKRGVYAVRLKRSAEAAIIQRTIEGLRWLADKGAEIVLLPELVSSSTVDRRIREWLQARDSVKPRLVITGTYLKAAAKNSRLRRNRAHAIDCCGVQLWYQDKLHQYTFTKDHQRQGRCELANADLVEDIDVSERTLFIADSPLGERIAVLICEDFARAIPQRQLLIELGVNVILVPVMNPARPDPATADMDWIKRYALDFANEPYALSLVGNSGALVFPPGRERCENDYACAIDSYKTKTYKTVQGFPKPQIDAVLLHVEL